MAFREPKQERKLLSQEHDLFYHKIPGAKTSIEAFLQKDLVVRFFPSEEKTYSSQVTWKECVLPIEQGGEVGYLQVFNERKEVEQRIPLLAKKRVEPTFPYVVKQQLAWVVTLCKGQKLLFGYLVAGTLFGLAGRYFVKRMRRRDPKQSV